MVDINIITKPDIKDIEALINLIKKRLIFEVIIAAQDKDREKHYIEYRTKEYENEDSEIINLLQEMELFLNIIKTKKTYKYYLKYKKDNNFIISKHIENENKSNESVKKITKPLFDILKSDYSEEKVTFYKNKRRMTLDLNTIIKTIISTLDEK